VLRLPLAKKRGHGDKCGAGNIKKKKKNPRAPSTCGSCLQGVMGISEERNLALRRSDFTRKGKIGGRAQKSRERGESLNLLKRGKM